nr:retrovirus-related Pol polyprotein from transposon TNT 1-94 [Tanacetum cinerariifolium]
MFPEWGRFMTVVKLNRGLKTSNYDQLYAYLKQHEAHANENKMILERYNQHAIDPLAFAPTTHTMFMENLSSTDPIYDKAGPSYDLDILSEVQDHDNYIDSVGEYLEVHEMQNNVKQKYIVDSDVEYDGDSNIILYEQYVKENIVQVVQKDTLEIAKITRKNMLEKMKSPLWIKEFDKTCKKRITPRGLTKGERDFEQTNECYLTEVIPFFQMLKKHFKGIETAFVKEVKEMKEIFEQMEAEVEQNAVDKRSGSESRPLMLNKENYVPWSSRLLRYAKSRPNGKLIHNSILNGPYVRRMIAEPGDAE